MHRRNYSSAKRNNNYRIMYKKKAKVLTASIITNTLSLVVGFEGSIPRKERNDFPDCCWGDILLLTSNSNYEIFPFMYMFMCL